MFKKLRKLIIAISGGSVAILALYLLRKRDTIIPRPAARENLINVDVVPSEDLVQVLELPAKKTADKPVAAATAQALQTDDLKRIEGIGPKTASILNQSGIVTFETLAAHTPEEIKAILRAAKARGVPNSWPQQARLAAAADWDGLAKLQAELKGGL